MNRTELLDLFKRTAADIAGRDFDFLDETSLIADMGVDSLAMAEVVGEMENELEVQIFDEDLVGIESIAQLLDLMERLLAER